MVEKKKKKKEEGSEAFSTGVRPSMGRRLTYTLKLEIPAQTQICFQHVSRCESPRVCVRAPFFSPKGVVPER